MAEAPVQIPDWLEYRSTLAPNEGPSLQGWWICCVCKRENDSTIWGDCCPDCGHIQCDDCTQC
ncbi:hypothetical protein BJ875DRAFT_377158 [Amylocarpus encephaloides]|uniref:Uncharacterized protein n=1 Tax=Amylocarpus encephaloides TaxID=45428 RepID=A0A9P7YJA2_9HELO|nr:hypothetical protein BJ875DRAFT_377158 [Amylocarpus encephaloides]